MDESELDEIPTFRTPTGTGAGESDGSTTRPDLPWWDPGADNSVSPDTDSVLVDGFAVAKGSSVILWPGQRRTDAQDMFLTGMRATVRAVLFDIEEDSAPYLAVTLDDDPAADMLDAYGRYRYFNPDEVEPTVRPNTSGVSQ